MNELRHEPRGHLARYSAWQFRDYLMDKGVGTLIVMILAGYLSYQVTRMVPTNDRGANEAYAVVCSSCSATWCSSARCSRPTGS